MNQRTNRLPALIIALGIIMGAFGAHALKDLLTPADLAIYQTAVFYQLISGVGLIGLRPDSKSRFSPSKLIILGTFIFSGSLYLLALSGQRWLGAITPIGGLLMIFGWLLVGLRSTNSSNSEK